MMEVLGSLRTDPTFAYLFAVSGGGALFFVAWWLFCILVRNGIDGVAALSKAVGERRWPDAKKILLGTWK
jgi:hypothetical protein